MCTKSITVAIVDDDVLVRSGLRRLISSLHDIQVLGEAESAEGALDLVRGMDADVLLLDHSMPGRTGLDVLPEIRAAAPRTQVIMFSSNPAGIMRSRALRAGACQFLEKPASLEQLAEAIRVAAKS